MDKSRPSRLRIEDKLEELGKEIVSRWCVSVLQPKKEMLISLADELDETFQLVHDVPQVDQLPDQYQQLIEWASLWVGQLI